jgi:hypothetical protein
LFGIPHVLWLEARNGGRAGDVAQVGGDTGSTNNIVEGKLCDKRACLEKER